MVVDLDTTVVAQQVLSRICRAQTGQNVGPASITWEASGNR